MGEQVVARSNGGVAQLGEHLPCKQGVKSSNLSVSTSGLYNVLRGEATQSRAGTLFSPNEIHLRMQAFQMNSSALNVVP